MTSMPVCIRIVLLAPLTLIGPKGEVTVFGLGPKCDDLQCLGAMRLGEQKLIDVLLDSGEG
jgi:hypothetical protein